MGGARRPNTARTSSAAARSIDRPTTGAKLERHPIVLAGRHASAPGHPRRSSQYAVSEAGAGPKEV